MRRHISKYINATSSTPVARSSLKSLSSQVLPYFSGKKSQIELIYSNYNAIFLLTQSQYHIWKIKT